MIFRGKVHFFTNDIFPRALLLREGSDIFAKGDTFARRHFCTSSFLHEGKLLNKDTFALGDSLQKGTHLHGVSVARRVTIARRLFYTKGYFCTRGHFCITKLLHRGSLLHGGNYYKKQKEK